MVEKKGVLVTLGEEGRVRSPLLKTWDLEKVDKKLSMGTPILLRSVKVQMGNQPHPVSLCLLWIYRFLSNIFSFSPFTISFIILSPTHSIKI